LGLSAAIGAAQIQTTWTYGIKFERFKHLELQASTFQRYVHVLAVSDAVNLGNRSIGAGSRREHKLEPYLLN
jgi:hypothetical protein